VRRTSTVDITVDDTGSRLSLRGAARDLAVAALAEPSDPYAWHPVDPLPAWSMRRARRLDLRFPPARGDFEIRAFFRDTRVADDGVERCGHSAI
jgi:hypothetical protein